MDNELLIAAIDAAEQASYSSEGDTTLSTDRAYAIDMYSGKNLEPAPEGRSQVVDRSVFETIQWILPSLVDIYANGDDVVEITPVSEEDEPGAKQETQYLNHLILQKNSWFVTFITWAMDAMMTKNGYCLAYSERRRNEEIDRYERQTEQGVLLMQQDKDVHVQVTAQYPDPDYVEPPPQPAVDPMTGQPVIVIGPDGQPLMQPPPPAPMLYDVTVTRVQEERKICYKVLPPERCKISYRTPDFSISQECPYFEYYDYKTLSDLRADGFQLPEQIPDDWLIDEEEDLARDNYDEQGWRDDNNEPDQSMKRYRVRMIWILHDENQDGIAERIYAVRIGRQIIHKEQCSRIPVASLVAIPNPHRHIATSIADIVADLQRIKTAILRQGLDNLYLANNPRTFITDKINLDDALVSRPGGIVRGETGAVFGQDIAPLVTPFVFPQAMEGLEYMDQIRENRTGTNRYFTGIDQNAMNKTATGIQQLSSMAAQRVKLIARIMGCGIADLFSIIHELILKGGHKKEVVKLSNKWVEVDPAQWKKRTDFRIAVGYAAGNKDAMIQKLMLILNAQKEALMGGLPVVTPENVHASLVELTKAADFATPERFWTDPSKIPQKGPPQPDPTVVFAEQMKAQVKDKEIQADLYKCEKETQIKKYEIDTKAHVDLVKTEAQIESANHLEDKRVQTEDKKIGAQIHLAQTAPKAIEANTKSAKAQQEGAFIQQFMQSQQQQTQAIAQMFQEVLGAVQRLGGAKKVVRGKDGRIDSVVPVE
jgi:hypothetical protein